VDTLVYQLIHRLDRLPSVLKAMTVEFGGRRCYQGTMLLEQNLKLGHRLNSNNPFAIELLGGKPGLAGEVNRCCRKDCYGDNGNCAEKIKLGRDAVAD
jgi:hypothetical protein